MRSYFAPAIAMAMITPAILSARSDDVPTLDVNPVCHGIAMQGELEAGLQQTSFQQCVKSEQDTREQLKKEWSTFTTADKSHCVALAKTGGESSYTELITCMEMARDVRKLHEDQQKKSATSSTAVPEGLPAPVGHRQPTEATTSGVETRTPSSSRTDTAPQPSSTNPPNTGADSTLKELERVKKDAQNARIDEQKARASEAAVQRKLADTEADLKRAKGEAARATEEAKQAKTDAQSAREAQAKAENKLADADAARAAAEDRLKASEDAAKNQRGFGARLRGLFGHKPSNQ